MFVYYFPQLLHLYLYLFDTSTNGDDAFTDGTIGLVGGLRIFVLNVKNMKN